MPTPRKPAAKKPATATKRKPAAKRRVVAAGTVSPKPVGALVAVFGPFGSRALVEVRADAAQAMVQDGVLEPMPRFLVDTVDAELAALEEREPRIAAVSETALARALAFEIAYPHNSATSKAANSKELRETLATLREMVPPEVKDDAVDRLRGDVRR